MFGSYYVAVKIHIKSSAFLLHYFGKHWFTWLFYFTCIICLLLNCSHILNINHIWGIISKYSTILSCLLSWFLCWEKLDMQLKCLLSKTKKIKERIIKKGESRRRDGLNIVKNMNKKQCVEAHTCKPNTWSWGRKIYISMGSSRNLKIRRWIQYNKSTTQCIPEAMESAGGAETRIPTLIVDPFTMAKKWGWQSCQC